jgi:tetratricopeptide (TPR) repeat protein
VVFPSDPPRSQVTYLTSLGTALLAQARLEEALQVFERLGRDEEALLWLDKVLNLNPEHLAALYNKAYALRELRRFDEAIAFFLRIKALHPREFVSELYVEHTLLLTGNFKGG